MENGPQSSLWSYCWTFSTNMVNDFPYFEIWYATWSTTIGYLILPFFWHLMLANCHKHKCMVLPIKSLTESANDYPQHYDLDETLSTIWAGKTAIPTICVLESNDFTPTTSFSNHSCIDYGAIKPTFAQQDVLLLYSKVQFFSPWYVFCS